MSGILDRWPQLKFISVESGVNWVPGLLETLEYQIAENADTLKYDLSPREYFERNMFATFWYEKRNIAASIRQAGVDNVMFETDFPHPTCLYPDPLEQAAPALAQLTVDERRKVMSTNAATLFNIPI
jgi:predicted TIM-barrel fold metal-dependent hydrolase